MNNKKNHRKFPKLLLLVFLFLTIGIILSSIQFYKGHQNQIKSEAQNNLAAVADLKVRQIQQWQEDHMVHVEFIRDNLLFVRQIDKYFRNPDRKNQDRDLFEVMKSFKNHFGYESVLLLDTKGIVRLAISPHKDTIGSYTHKLINYAILHRKVIKSDLHKSEAIPFIHIDLIIPILSSIRNDSSVTGILLFRIDPNIALFPLLQSWPTPSRTAETILLERSGDSVLYLNELRYKKNTSLRLRLPISNEQLPASMTVRGIEGTIEGIDYRGIPVFAAVRRVANSPWYILTKIDQDEVYEPLQSQILINSLAIFFIILSIGAIIGFGWRHQRAKFYRKQYEAELERKALITHFEHIIKYANDIILLTNMDGRIIEANDQACRSYGYTREEMTQLNLRHLQAPDHGDKNELHMKRVEKEDGLVFEGKHRRKDGTKFAVEISSRFIKIDETRFYQSIIRDITERKQTENLLKDAYTRYQRLQANIPGMIYLYAVHSDGSFSFLYVSSASKTFFNLEPEDIIRDGKLLADLIHPDDKTRRDESIRVSAKTLRPWREELRHIVDGHVRWFDCMSRPELQPNGDVYWDGIMLEITERKRAEKELKLLVSRNEAILTSVPDIIMEVDNNKVYTWANRAGIEFFGKDVIGKEAAFYFEGEQEIYQEVEPIFSGDENTIYIESWQRRRDGKKCLLGWWCRVLKDEKGNVAGALSTARDITDSKYAEESVRKSEELFKMLVESSPVAIVVFSSTTKNIDYVSHRFTELFGYEQKDITSMDSWWPLAYPIDEYRNQIESIWNTSVEKAKLEANDIEPLESVITCKDGSNKYIESTFSAMGELTLVFFTDLTQHRMAEEALRQTHAFNDLLIQTMPFGMNIVDEEGNILFVSKAMKEILTVNVLDMCCWQVYKDDNKQCENCPLRKGITFGKPEMIEVSGMLGGKTFQISHIGMMYEGRKAIMEVFQDITEQKKLQQELIQSQKLFSIGTMAGGIAHDFNNILGIIIGYTSILQSTKTNPEKFSEGINAIKQAVDRGAGLVRQILTFARKTDISFEPLSISNLVNEIVSMLQQTFPKIITFNTSIEKQLPYINADHTQIHQALLNLCVNARDAMPSGGEIIIHAELVDGKEIKKRFSSANDDCYLCLNVSDTGSGIDEAVRNQIFDPFFTTKEKGKGTGLGLSVVYGIVQAHHGFIDVESTVGSGTTFHLYFPVPLESGGQIESHEQVNEQITGGTETVLLVEDETLLLDMMQILLESNGYSVLTAKDGLEAVDVYAQHAQEIALVISDMGLPKLAGMAEYEKLKEINPDVKIVFASGYFEPESRGALENAGAKGFLQKPYVIEEALMIIRKVLD